MLFVALNYLPGYGFTKALGPVIRILHVLFDIYLSKNIILSYVIVSIPWSLSKIRFILFSKFSSFIRSTMYLKKTKQNYLSLY